jgi:hypothetical protein
MTVSVTTSSSVATTTTLATTSGDESTLDSYSTQQTLLDSSTTDAASDDDALALVLGGEATAIGDGTLALGSIEALIDETGAATIVDASVDFGAVGTSADDTAFATATTYGDVSGSDYTVVIGRNTEVVHQDPDQSVGIATSETSVHAVELGGDGQSSSGDAPVSTSESGPLDDVDISDFLFDSSIDLDGNLAEIDVSATALGSDTLLDVEVSVLTVEDTLSTLSGALVGAVQ